MLSPGQAAALADLLGAGGVVLDPEVVASYTVDWTGRFRGHVDAVARPATTAEVAALVGWCAAEGMALVPQGGNTGLVGGSVPLAGELVVSLRRLGALDVDGAAGQATLGAGVALADLQRAAGRAGWEYAVDFGARDSATVGGTIATNAGGARVVRHGMTRAQVMGVEAVLGDGHVVSHLGGLAKDNTGYDLAQLLCGSEGTLGIVTAARVRLVPPAPVRVVALVGFESVGAMAAAAGALRRDLPSLDAAEFFLPDGLGLVCEATGLAAPLAASATSAAAYLLVEAAGVEDPTPALGDAVDSLVGVVGVAVAAPGEPARRETLWRYREAHTEAINVVGPPHKLDVTLPATTLAPFLVEVPARVRAVAPEARTWLFGHAGDGNAHVNVTGIEPDEDGVDEAVLSYVVECGGSISAEHGIGTAKKRWLTLVRTDAEIAAFRAIKAALDPAGILNPNVLLP